jgi:hypothetical protein
MVIYLILLVGIIGLGEFLKRKSYQNIKKTEDEIKNIYQELKKYETAKEKAPSPELIKKLTQKKEFLEKQFEIMVTNFSTRYPFPPKFEKYPSIEFKEYIYFNEDKLHKIAKKRNVGIPISLGFQKTGLVDPSQISNLTLQFEVIKDLINLIIDSGIMEISNLTTGAPQKVAFYEIVPIKLTITGTSNDIIRCLRYFDNPSSYFTVENITIIPKGEESYQAEINLNSVILKKEKEG